MIFEDMYVDKQSEIISLYKDAENDNVDVIYIYIFNNEFESMVTTGFKVENKLVYSNEAGISDEQDDEIYDVIVDEIIPELEEICKRNNREMPVEFKLIYNIRTGSFDANYKYKNDVDADYDYGIAAQEWVRSFK